MMLLNALLSFHTDLQTYISQICHGILTSRCTQNLPEPSQIIAVH